MSIQKGLGQKTVRKNPINPNLLSDNQATCGKALGNTTGYAGTNGTLTYDNTKGKNSNGCLKLVCSGGNASITSTTISGILPSTYYSFQVEGDSQVASNKTHRIIIAWYTSADVYISESFVDYNTANGFRTFFVSGQSPANAAKCQIYSRIMSPAVGDIIWQDMGILRKGTY